MFGIQLWGQNHCAVGDLRVDREDEIVYTSGEFGCGEHTAVVGRDPEDAVIDDQRSRVDLDDGRGRRSVGVETY
ncbi:hypothetical protein [Nocardia sp. SC052]|uniref:hypothetical protein n=1 Tax=Nocardia sichangensis TaxID=3385975 RepID=UPI0039A2FED5